jgi:ABC-type phosphate/phosphonate transport system ATPase subunit
MNKLHSQGFVNGMLSALINIAYAHNMEYLWSVHYLNWINNYTNRMHGKKQGDIAFSGTHCLLF